MDPESYTPFAAENRDAALSEFDKNVRESIDILKAQSDEHMLGTWTMEVGGAPVISMPRVAVMRAFVFNHAYHHRGQLSVYLRLKDVPLPQVYGPTADEPNMGPA